MVVCLLRGLGNPALCEPKNPAYIAIHGMSGKGGRIGSAAIPEEYIGLLLDELSWDERVDREIKAYASSFERQFEDKLQEAIDNGKSRNEARIKSIYLYSESPGTGKTTAATALLQDYLLKNFLGHISRRLDPPLKPVYFLDVNKLQSDYNAFNRSHLDEDQAKEFARIYYNKLKRAQESELVVFDDIGVRTATDGFRGDLHDVVNHRVANGMPTIYTSNIPMSGLVDVFGETRLYDRIRDMTREIHFEGGSKRGMRR